MKNIETKLRSIKKKRLLVVYPHPDDETYNAAGLIQRAKSLGFEVMIVSLTSGDMGKNHLEDKRDLGVIRREELLLAGKILRADVTKALDYPDCGLIEDLHWTGNLKKILKKFDPGVVVTYDHSGLTGHPDHIVLSVELFKILKRAKDRPLLLWSVWPGEIRRFMIHDEVVGVMNEPEYELKLSIFEWLAKRKALFAHKSQLGNLKDWQRLLLIYGIFWKEYFAVANFKVDYDYKYVKFEI